MVGMKRLWTLHAPQRPLRGRQTFVAIGLLVASLTSLACCLISPNPDTRGALLVFSLLTLAMLPWVRLRALWSPLIHLTTLLAWALITFTACQTGAIHSPALVWLFLLALPVLWLQGPRPALVWVAIVLTTLLALLAASLTGHVDSHLHGHASALPWAYLNQALALGNLLMAWVLRERLHRQRLQRLQQRQEALERTHTAMREALARQDEFVAAVGHELRTPMNAILGLNGDLRQALSDRPEQVAWVDHIRNATAHLLQEVNDILDLSQLQAGQRRLHLEDIGLQSLMDEALQTERYPASAPTGLRSGTLDPALPPRVRGDRRCLLQILRKFLGLALGGAEQGDVRLHIHAAHGRLNFEVHHRGPTTVQEAPHAQMPILRTEGDLDLSLCEKWVALHGGQMGVHRLEGQGTTCWFHVPLVPADDDPAASPDELPADEALRILVVDDNAMNLMVARAQLQQCWPRAEVVTLDSAAQALALLDEQVFDVALVDMLMPGMDGMALTRQIRQQFAAVTRRMPIIALTANANPAERARCRDAGMDDVLDKPTDLSTLSRCVSRHVLRARG